MHDAQTRPGQNFNALKRERADKSKKPLVRASSLLALLRPSAAVALLALSLCPRGILGLLFITRVRGRPQDLIHRVSTLQGLQRSSSDLPPSPLRRVTSFTARHRVWFPSPSVIIIYHMNDKKSIWQYAQKFVGWIVQCDGGGRVKTLMLYCAKVLAPP